MRKLLAVVMIASIASAAMGGALVKEDFTDGVIDSTNITLKNGWAGDGVSAVGALNVARQDAAGNTISNGFFVEQVGASNKFGIGFQATFEEVSLGADDVLISKRTVFSDAANSSSNYYNVGVEGPHWMNTPSISTNTTFCTVDSQQQQAGANVAGQFVWSDVVRHAAHAGGTTSAHLADLWDITQLIRPSGTEFVDDDPTKGAKAEVETFGANTSGQYTINVNVPSQGFSECWVQIKDQGGPESGDALVSGFDGTTMNVQTGMASFEYGITKNTDFDLDYDTDFADFNVLSNNYGTGTTMFEGDADNDGDVDFTDFNELSNNYGDAYVQGVPGDLDADEVELVVDITTGEMKLVSGGAVELNGYSITSASGALVADADGSASPFMFYLSNTASEVAAGNVGSKITLDGELALDAGFAGDQDLAFEYGTAEGTFAGDIQYVPEPATLSLLAIGGVAALIRRKK